MCIRDSYYCEHTDEMPDEFLNLISKGTSKERVVCDFIACMSDPVSYTHIAVYKRQVYRLI